MNSQLLIRWSRQGALALFTAFAGTATAQEAEIELFQLPGITERGLSDQDRFILQRLYAKKLPATPSVAYGVFDSARSLAGAEVEIKIDTKLATAMPEIIRQAAGLIGNPAYAALATQQRTLMALRNLFAQAPEGRQKLRLERMEKNALADLKALEALALEPVAPEGIAAALRQRLFELLRSADVVSGSYDAVSFKASWPHQVSAALALPVVTVKVPLSTEARGEVLQAVEDYTAATGTSAGWLVPHQLIAFDAAPNPLSVATAPYLLTTQVEGQTGGLQLVASFGYSALEDLRSSSIWSVPVVIGGTFIAPSGDEIELASVTTMICLSTSSSPGGEMSARGCNL